MRSAEDEGLRVTVHILHLMSTQTHDSSLMTLNIGLFVVKGGLTAKSDFAQ